MGSTSCVKLVDGNEEKNAVIIRLMKNIAESKQQVVEAMEWAKTSVGKAEETVGKKQFCKRWIETANKGQIHADEVHLRLACIKQYAEHVGAEHSMIEAELEFRRLAKEEAQTKLLQLVQDEDMLRKRVSALQKECWQLHHRIKGPEMEMSLKQELQQIKERQQQVQSRINELKKEQKCVRDSVEEEKRSVREKIKRNEKSVNQEIETTYRRLRDERKWLEDELARLLLILEQKSSSSEEESYKFTHCQQQQLLHPCLLCAKYEAVILLLPCRHLVLCEDCKAGDDLCPSCNTRIHSRVSLSGRSNMLAC